MSRACPPYGNNNDSELDCNGHVSSSVPMAEREKAEVDNVAHNGDDDDNNVNDDLVADNNNDVDDDDDDDDDKKDDADGDAADPLWSLPAAEWTKREAVLFARRFLRSFGTGVTIYAGVRTLVALMKNPFRKSVPAAWRKVISGDCLRFAGFLGLYPSLYHLTVALLERHRKRRDGWNYGLAGGVAALSMALEDPSRQKTLTFFATARALGAGAGTLVSRGVLKPVPHADTLTFCACCSVLTSCTALFPRLLPAGYYHSVLKWSRDYTHSTLERLFRTPGDGFLTCREAGLHEGTCTSHALRDLVRSVPSFAKLYLPIHLAPVLVFKRDVLKNRPQYVLTSLARNLTNSTLFLATMVFLAKYVICILRHAAGKPPPLPLFVPATAGFVCGLSVLLERASRRKELVLFLIPQMLNVAHVLWKESSRSRSVSRRLPRGYVPAFAAAMGVVMHAYEREPTSLTMLMSGLLKFFVGKRKKPQASRANATEAAIEGEAGDKSEKAGKDGEKMRRSRNEG